MEALERVREYLKAEGHLEKLQTFAYRTCRLGESQRAEYIVEHQCTEWELERALLQYLKSITNNAFSFDSSTQ